MDIARARSPPASLGRRPVGPRSPGKPGTLPVKNIIPLDLSSRLQDDFGAALRTASPGVATFDDARPTAPASAPVQQGRPEPIASSVSSSSSSRPSSAQVNGHAHQRTESSKSKSVGAGDDAGGAIAVPTEAEDGERATSGLETAATRASVSPAPATPPIPDGSAPNETAPDILSDVARPAIGTDGHVRGTNGTASPEPFAPTPSSSEPTAMAGIPPLTEGPTQESVEGAEELISPTELAAADILDMYAPPPPPIVPPEEGITRAAPRPPSTQLTGMVDASDVESIDGVHAVSGGGGHRQSLSEKSPQASVAAIRESASTPTSTRASTPSLLKAISKRPLLAPPPAISFDVDPVKWKGMTLDAAQWTFTSEQLQETVSRAIRQSASESFIRIVSTETYDVELPQELERLASLRATTQAQYRFAVHRRAMLLQSLAALSQSQSDGDGEALYSLTTQLAELTTSCDRMLETLMRVADQKAQIQRVQDLHIASALAMALRKLNASYAKRTAELQETRTRNEELKAELEEAWNMAQDMAQEMDDLDNFDLAFSDEEFTPTPEDDQPSNSALEAEIYNDMDRMSHVSSMRNAELVEITGKAVVTKAMITNLPGADPQRSGERTSRVSAAKKRSSRASKASLRIPKTPTNGASERPDRTSIYSIRSRRSRSKSVRRVDRGEGSTRAPDVPIIRLPEPSRSKEGSFLELSQTRPGSPAVSTAEAPPPLPPKEGVHPTNLAATRSEEVLPAPYGSNPPSASASATDSIPTINLPGEEQHSAKRPTWTGRRFFARRVHSMQPPLRAADDTATAPQIKRSASEYKQFDGWPFLGSSKAQRFSVPVLSAMQNHRTRKSSDSAPVEHS